MITADMFPPFSIIRKCVFIFHEQNKYGWLVPATFDSQTVRNYSHFICVPSRLTCSRHFQLSDSAYLYFMSNTIMADMFLPLLTLSLCVIPFHELDRHGLHFLLSGSSYLYFTGNTNTADVFLPVLTLSRCVIPFHELHHDHGRHVSAIFDY